MNKLALGLFAVLALLGVSFAAQKESSFSGVITDRNCAKANSHEMMMKRHNSPTTKECIPACVKAGGAYVLLDPATKTIYELDVKVTGTYDKATQTIHVSGITATK